MPYVETPSKRSLSAIAWALAFAFATMAIFSPGPVAGALLLILAFGLLGAIARGNRRVEARTRAKVETLGRNVAILEKAEELAGYGRWCVELDGMRHLWSEEMCRLAGLRRGTPPTHGLIDRILPEGFAQIMTVIDAHAGDVEPFAIEFEVMLDSGQSRILRARATNVFSPEGRREQVFMVVRDVTADYALRREFDDALAMAATARREADTDALTGLANRRCAMRQLDQTVVAARQDGRDLSIVVFDIDHFKAVNDRHGHLAGDKALRKIGRIAQRQARDEDLVGRIGGEEFIWIMPGCNSEAALRAAERLRWAVEAGTHSAPIPSVTISAGHAQWSVGDTSLTFFARADAALYEAKRGGRNRVAQAA